MEEYERAIAKFGLKEQEIEGDQGDAQEHLPFSVEMFHHLLMKWIVADDQVRLSSLIIDFLGL